MADTVYKPTVTLKDHPKPATPPSGRPTVKYVPAKDVPKPGPGPKVPIKDAANSVDQAFQALAEALKSPQLLPETVRAVKSLEASVFQLKQAVGTLP